ncbi:MAG: protein kinase domain-containing protein [Bradymonadia bacterium]
MSAPSHTVCPLCDVPRTLPVGHPCPDHPDRALLDPAIKARHQREAMLGRRLGDKYALIDLLGKGGFGAVYRAIQHPVGREVAVKVIRQGEGDNPEMRARFFREAKVVARLSHPATVTLHDYGEEDGALYMVFELVKGRSLASLLRSDGPMAPKRVVDLTVQILGALSEAHDQGCVHRDLKPDNVMITLDPWGAEKAKVLDFGIAKMVSEKEGADRETLTVETVKGYVLGTPRYMAPEQARSATIDGRTDLYTLGVVIYEMLTGKAPFHGDTPLSVLLAHINEPVPPMPERLGIPEPLQHAIRQALSKRPDERFGNAETMARSLVAALPDAEGLGGLAGARRSADGKLETLPLPGEAISDASPAPVVTPSFSGEAPPETRPAGNAWLLPGVVLALLAGGGAWWALSTGDGGVGAVPPDSGPPTGAVTTPDAVVQTKPDAAAPADATAPPAPPQVPDAEAPVVPDASVPPPKTPKRARNPKRGRRRTSTPRVNPEDAPIEKKRNDLPEVERTPKAETPAAPPQPAEDKGLKVKPLIDE